MVTICKKFSPPAAQPSTALASLDGILIDDELIWSGKSLQSQFLKWKFQFQCVIIVKIPTLSDHNHTHNDAHYDGQDQWSDNYIMKISMLSDHVCGNTNNIMTLKIPILSEHIF